MHIRKEKLKSDKKTGINIAKVKDKLSYFVIINLALKLHKNLLTLNF